MIIRNTNINSIKQYIFILQQLGTKEHKRKTSETNLGLIWNVLDPLLYMVILSTYYSNVITHDNVENFPIFVFTGIIVLKYYTHGTTYAMRCLVSNKQLLQKTHVTSAVFVYHSVLLAFKEFCYSSMALVPILIFYHIPVSKRILQVIPLLVLTTMVIIGVGRILAIGYAFFADVGYLYSIFTTLLFFISSVLVPLSHMPVKFQSILTYNPVFLSIYVFRNSMVYNLPSHWTSWVKLGFWAVVFQLFGYYLFEKKIDDVCAKL